MKIESLIKSLSNIYTHIRNVDVKVYDFKTEISHPVTADDIGSNADKCTICINREII